MHANFCESNRALRGRRGVVREAAAITDDSSRRAWPALFLFRKFEPSPFSFLILCLFLTLAGCGTFSGRSGSSTQADSPRSSSRAGTGAPIGRGGYYLDDGPGANAPENLDEIADAVPKIEPLNRATARPYTVMGRYYTPMTELAPYRERGIATWYGRRYHGKQTSSGEQYDMYGMTAAHTTLPIPSYARVTNLGNGRSVVVRINDRGPFIGDRLIDLSFVAAHKLEIVRNGSGLVEVETVLPSGDGAAGSPPVQPRIAASTSVAPIAATPQDRPEQVPPMTADAAGHYLQLAAFSLKENAERFVERVRVQLDGVSTQIRIVPTGALYRIHAGPYADRPAAEQAALRIEALLGAAPILATPY